MRTRSRYIRIHPPGIIGYSQIRRNPPYTQSSSVITFGVFNDKYDSITDRTRIKVTKEDRAKRRRRLAAARRLLKGAELTAFRSDLYTQFLTVNPCTHGKYEAKPPKDGGSAVHAQSATYNHFLTYDGMAGFNYHVAGSSINAKITTLRNSTKSGSVDLYHDIDWFALLDQWHESCNNLMSPDTNIGESMVENGVFVDAFKTILNPTRILKYFLEFAKGNLGNKKYSSIGKVGKLLRDTSDASLSYKFGIKPALDELKRMLTAHTVVNERLKFLRENVGGYVPIRARQIVPSDVDSSGVDYSGSSILLVYDQRETVGVISALGKVRPDLSYAKDWHAYVQYFGLHKVFGLAWELVPFSFVIDWVTNAQEYVNKYLTPHYDGPFYNIRNICHSVTYQTVSKLMMSSQYYYNTWQATKQGGSPVELCRFIETNYSRASGLPTTSGSVDISRLGTFHGITSSSLLIQKAGALF